uniref:Peptidase M1 membrane alanine aminopeptidase domain-containing protein n=1 Tax=Poecilia latipinna TaxID=48699 RepID=A0A3B3TVE7_9TELE
ALQNFMSLVFCSPHIIFLSQSVLCKECPGSGLNRLTLSGSRICHEIAHSWFGLVIGARDWTEEWISEGFATFLEDIIWAQAQQVLIPNHKYTAEQFDLKALLRWRRLSDELQNSNEELQILRPNMDRTGQVSDSGSSTIKHALNPDKTFMQVHYLKGYFLLRFLASEVGDQHLIDFFRLFVKKYHGQLILSQVRLKFFERNIFLFIFPLFWLQVRHRWCELVVKHTYSQAYCDVEDFLLHDQVKHYLKKEGRVLRNMTFPDFIPCSNGSWNVVLPPWVLPRLLSCRHSVFKQFIVSFISLLLDVIVLLVSCNHLPSLCSSFFTFILPYLFRSSCFPIFFCPFIYTSFLMSLFPVSIPCFVPYFLLSYVSFSSYFLLLLLPTSFSCFCHSVFPSFMSFIAYRLFLFSFCFLSLPCSSPSWPCFLTFIAPFFFFFFFLQPSLCPLQKYNFIVVFDILRRLNW